MPSDSVAILLRTFRTRALLGVFPLTALVTLFTLGFVGCANGPPPPSGDVPAEVSGDVDATSDRAQDTTPSTTDHEDLRRRMVQRQIADRGVEDPDVLEAMRTVPRHRFVPEATPQTAYSDTPYPIGHGQTISQPYIVAFMAKAADIESGDRVLEIGTGSGYGAAVLAHLASEVYSIEIIPELAQRARRILEELGYENVRIRTGNGWLGWPEEAPFDAIVVTAAPDEVPEALVEQLAVGGTMVVPVGEVRQSLRIIEKTEEGLEDESVLPVRFVPMVEEPDGGAE